MHVIYRWRSRIWIIIISYQIKTPIYFESFIRRERKTEKVFEILFYLKHETDKNSFAFISCFAIVGARFTARDFPVAAQSSSCKFNCAREINRNKLESVLKQNTKKSTRKQKISCFWCIWICSHSLSLRKSASWNAALVSLSHNM